MIRSCRWQLRMGLGGAYGLDFGAVAAMAQGWGGMTPLLADCLPDIEAILVSSLRDPDGESGAPGEG